MYRLIVLVILTVVDTVNRSQTIHRKYFGY